MACDAPMIDVEGRRMVYHALIDIEGGRMVFICTYHRCRRGGCHVMHL